MFLRTFAEGVTNGWLPAEPFKARIQSAWRVLATQVNENGDVSGIVSDPPIFSTAKECEQHGTRLNDPRGMGAILYATIAVDEMLEGDNK